MIHAGENSFYFPLRLIADDGDATPCPCSKFWVGSEALRFVCFSCIASRVSKPLPLTRAPRFSQDISARAFPALLRPGTYFCTAL